MVSHNTIKIQDLQTYSNERSDRTTEQLFCLPLKERRGRLNTPCLPSSAIGRGCTDSNTKCSAGNCVCRDGYYERNAACSRKPFRFFGKTPY